MTEEKLWAITTSNLVCGWLIKKHKTCRHPDFEVKRECCEEICPEKEPEKSKTLNEWMQMVKDNYKFFLEMKGFIWDFTKWAKDKKMFPNITKKELNSMVNMYLLEFVNEIKSEPQGDEIYNE